MRKIFKKSVACLIAVLMIVSSLPLTVFAGGATTNSDLADDSEISTQSSTQTISVTNNNFYGVLKDGNGNSRFTDPTMTIVNDAQNSNFDIGFVTFDVSSLKGTNVTVSNANYTFNLTKADWTEDLGLKVYYPTKDTFTLFHASGQQTTGPSDVWAGDSTESSKVDHIGKAINYFGLQEIASYSTIAGNEGDKTVDISASLQWAIDNNKNNAVICFMLAKQGGIAGADLSGGTAKGWSDTYVKVTNKSVDVTVSEKTLDDVAKKFENKLNSSTVYKNVSPAYQAYVDIKKAIIAKKYGATIDESALVANLESAMNNMTVWSYTAPNVQIKSNADSTQTSDYTQRQSNVVYYSGNLVAGSPVLNESNQNSNTLLMDKYNILGNYKIWASIKIYHAGQTVFVYDDEKTPAFPVTVQLDRTASRSPSERAWYGYCTLKNTESNNAGLTFMYPTYWQKTSSGNCGNSDLPYLFNQNQTDYTNLRSDTDTNRSDTDHSNDAYYYANVVQFTGSMTDEQYSMTKYPVWETYAYNSDNGDNVKYIKLGGQSGYAATDNINYSNTPLYYINYKVVKDKISSFNTTVSNAIKTGNYTQGGASNAVSALDKLTSIDVSSYSYSSGIDNAVNAYTNDAKSAVTAADSATFTQDSQYAELEAAVESKKALFEAGNTIVENGSETQKYTTSSWNNFSSAYKNAIEHLKGLVSNNFDVSQAKTLTDNLNNAVLEERPIFTFVKSNGDSTTVRADDASLAYYWAVTAGKYPNTESTEITALDNGKHTWTTYSWPTEPTDNVFKEIAETHTENCTIGEDGICSLCKQKLIDYSAYDSAITDSETIKNDSQYTDLSRQQYSEVVESAKITKDSTATQDKVNTATAKILAAKSLLRKKSCTITVKKVVGDEESDVTTITKDYGTSEDIDIVSLTNNEVKGVEKWTITTDDGNTVTRLNTLDTSVTLYVTKDVTITAYASNEASDSTSSKVVFLGLNGRVAEVRYLQSGISLDTSKVPAPSVPFYTFTKWSTDSVTGNGETIYVRAEYTCTVSSDWCVVHFVDASKNIVSSKKYDYDSYARIPDDINGTYFALASDKDGNNILTYLDGRDFYVPYVKDIYAVVVENREPKIAITGSYSNPYNNGSTAMTYATFNCKFYLPNDCTLVEWGAEISAIGRTQVVKGEKISKNNEYSITMNINASTSITAFDGVAYVTYKDSDGAIHTIKSASVTQTLTKA